MPKLLVIDDEESICWGLSQLGERIGHEVVTASSAEQGLEAAAALRPDAIVLDVRLPGMDGLTAIEHFRRQVGDVPIIVITAYGDLNTAVNAVRNGAFEYIVKPFELENVKAALVRAMAQGTRRAETKPLASAIGGMVGRSAAMQEVFTRIALAAASDANVLIGGESGTGKELAARAVHQYSRRESGPFVAVNVAALSDSLAESELFGHATGAFTGAQHARDGLLLQADGGTLFLDEVADIPLSTQVKLLRAIEHGEVTPVGANHSTPSDFRIVCASHQALRENVRRGEFRHDLYFRLCAFEIEMPPLRERREDIPDLARYFVESLSPDGAARPQCDEQFLTELGRRPWYGNVRELRNAIEHALIVSRRARLMPEHLPPAGDRTLMGASASGAAGEPRLDELTACWARARLAADGAGELHAELLAEIEPALFREALRQASGQVAVAARQLGIHRTTLKKKLEQYGLLEGDS